MEKLKLVHQLFIGKVADEIGMERTSELFKEAKEAFAIPRDSKNGNLLRELLGEIEDGKLIQEHGTVNWQM